MSFCKSGRNIYFSLPLKTFTRNFLNEAQWCYTRVEVWGFFFFKWYLLYWYFHIQTLNAVESHLHQHGADPSKKNRDGNTPLDLVKEGDTDIQDLLRGDAALLEAVKKGCLTRVKKLCSLGNVNCRDTQGRHSTPLHLAG